MHRLQFNFELRSCECIYFFVFFSGRPDRRWCRRRSSERSRRDTDVASPPRRGHGRPDRLHVGAGLGARLQLQEVEALCGRHERRSHVSGAVRAHVAEELPAGRVNDLIKYE